MSQKSDILLPAATPPIIVAIIGVCKRGCIQAIKRNINPSAAMAYNTRGNGKSEPSNDVKIPKEIIFEKIYLENRINKPANAPIPTIYLNAGK